MEHLERCLGFQAVPLLISYATLLYLLAVVLVPARIETLRETFTHFLAVRCWFFAVLVTAAGVDIIDSLLKGVGWGTDLAYWAYRSL